MSYLMKYDAQDGELQNFSAHKVPTFKEVKNKEWVLWGYSTEWEDLRISLKIMKSP